MNKLRLYVARAAVAAALLTFPVRSAEVVPLDEFVSTTEVIKTFDYTQSRDLLSKVSGMVAATRDNLTARMAALLSTDASSACQQFLCRELAIVGSESEVGALAPLLVEEKYSDMARYALEGTRGAKTCEALRAALGKTTGRTRIGIINSLGVLKDASSVAPLAELVQAADSDLLDAVTFALSNIGGVEAEKALKARAADEDAFVPLFNGRDLTGWDGSGWTVEDGVMVCHGGFLTWKQQQFTNFILRFEVKLSPGANNGLNFRSRNSHWNEIQILDETHPGYATIHDYQAPSSLYGVVAARRGFSKTVGQWNTQEVVADGTHIKVTLDGTVVVNADLSQLDLDKCLDGTAHPGFATPPAISAGWAVPTQRRSKAPFICGTFESRRFHDARASQQ